MRDAVRHAAERAWADGERAPIELDRARNRASAASIARTVRDLCPDVVLDPAALTAAGALAERHAPILVRWIDELAARDWLRTRPAGAGRTELAWLREAPGARETAEAWAEAHAIASGTALTGFFARAAGHLPELLADTVQVQSLLFEDDDVTDEIYRSNEASRYTNAAAAAAVRAHLETRTAPAVWEIGGGTGATTEPVLDAVRDLDLRYHFTDVGRWFLEQALDRWAGRAGLTVGLADINDPALLAHLPLPPSGGYDIALAANVLHNAADPIRALAAVARAVAEDGLLVMIETAREHLPLLVSMRFLMSPSGPGARFADRRAETGRIFLSLPEWEDALARSGWQLELVAPGPDPSHPAARYDQHLLVARRLRPEIGTA